MMMVHRDCVFCIDFGIKGTTAIQKSIPFEFECR